MSTLTELIAKRRLEHADKLAELTAALERDPIDTDEMLTHYFVPKIYGRQIDVPAGTTIVTKLHKHDHLCVVLKGKCMVVDVNGKTFIEAPTVMITKAGTKRAVHVVEDTTWLTVHPNEDDGQDLDKIEDYVISPSFEEYDKYRLEVDK